MTLLTSAPRDSGLANCCMSVFCVGSQIPAPIMSCKSHTDVASHAVGMSPDAVRMSPSMNRNTTYTHFIGRLTTWPTSRSGIAMVSRCPAMTQPTTSFPNPNLSWKNSGMTWQWLQLSPTLNTNIDTMRITSRGSRSTARISRRAERRGGWRLASCSEKKNTNAATQTNSIAPQSQNTLSTASTRPVLPAASQYPAATAPTAMSRNCEPLVLPMLSMKLPSAVS